MAFALKHEIMNIHLQNIYICVNFQAILCIYTQSHAIHAYTIYIIPVTFHNITWLQLYVLICALSCKLGGGGWGGGPPDPTQFCSPMGRARARRRCYCLV